MNLIRLTISQSGKKRKDWQQKKQRQRFFSAASDVVRHHRPRQVDVHSGERRVNHTEIARGRIRVQMKTGIEQALLSKYETGERIPPTETLIRLAEFYGVSIDYILCRTENPNINE